MIAENEEVKDLKFIKATINKSSAIDGFKGNIIFASLEFEAKDEKFEILCKSNSEIDYNECLLF